MSILSPLKMLTPSLLITVFGMLVLFGFSKNEKVTIYLVGDSTMSEKKVSAYPETGWGMPFRHYFTDDVEVENHAVNGRSTRTFIEEGRWEAIKKTLKADDYVLIQFGHNDEVQSKLSSTTPEQFQGLLRQYIEETREAGAKPILLTPIARRHFDEQGDLKDTHEQYSALMREVAESTKVPLIDMDKKSRDLLEELGPEKSTLLFLHLNPGQNPNYPNGVTDDTHFSETGARMMAELVLQGLKALELPISLHIVHSRID